MKKTLEKALKASAERYEDEHEHWFCNATARGGICCYCNAHDCGRFATKTMAHGKPVCITIIEHFTNSPKDDE